MGNFISTKSKVLPDTYITTFVINKNFDKTNLAIEFIQELLDIRPNLFNVLKIKRHSFGVIMYYNGYFESFNIDVDRTKLTINKNVLSNDAFNTELMEIGIKIFCNFHGREIITSGSYDVVDPEQIKFDLSIESIKTTAEIIDILEYFCIKDPNSYDLSKMVQAIYMLSKLDISPVEEEALIEFKGIGLAMPYVDYYLVMVLAYRYPEGENRERILDYFATVSTSSKAMKTKIYKYHVFRAYTFCDSVYDSRYCLRIKSLVDSNSSYKEYNFYWEVFKEITTKLDKIRVQDKFYDEALDTMDITQQLRLGIRSPANIRKFLEENKQPYPVIKDDYDRNIGDNNIKKVQRKRTLIGQIESIAETFLDR